VIPSSLIVEADTVMIWASDTSVTMAGFTICATATPTTTAPTNAPGSSGSSESDSSSDAGTTAVIVVVVVLVLVALGVGGMFYVKRRKSSAEQDANPYGRRQASTVPNPVSVSAHSKFLSCCRVLIGHTALHCDVSASPSLIVLSACGF
jgi:hypothetical protein